MPNLSEILELLERDDALRLNDPPDVWPNLPPDADVYELDFEQLFPRRSNPDGEQDWDLYGDQGWEVPGGLEDRLAESPDQGKRGVRPPGWDVCAWYQPIHFFGPSWGIFLYDDCIVDAARSVHTQLGRPPLNPRLVRALIRAGFAALFLHEQYHHKVESFALRLHVVEQSPKYVDYFRGVYMPAAGTDDQIEEALANADSFLRLANEPYRNWLRGSLRYAAEEYLRASFASAPPGYSLATGLLNKDRRNFQWLEHDLAARVQDASLVPRRVDPQDFGVVTHLFHPLFAIQQNIWTIASRGAKPLLPVKPGGVAPLSRAAVEKYLRRVGYEHQKGRGKGSHRVYSKAHAPTIVLPDSKDLSHVVLRNTAQALGFRSARDLVENVRD